jgi:hypothetical protein
VVPLNHFEYCAISAKRGVSSNALSTSDILIQNMCLQPNQKYDYCESESGETQPPIVDHKCPYKILRIHSLLLSELFNVVRPITLLKSSQLLMLRNMARTAPRSNLKNEIIFTGIASLDSPKTTMNEELPTLIHRDDVTSVDIMCGKSKECYNHTG